MKNDKEFQVGDSRESNQAGALPSTGPRDCAGHNTLRKPSCGQFILNYPDNEMNWNATSLAFPKLDPFIYGYCLSDWGSNHQQVINTFMAQV